MTPSEEYLNDAIEKLRAACEMAAAELQSELVKSEEELRRVFQLQFASSKQKFLAGERFRVGQRGHVFNYMPSPGADANAILIAKRHQQRPEEGYCDVLDVLENAFIAEIEAFPGYKHTVTIKFEELEFVPVRNRHRSLRDSFTEPA